jgi:hypothetical protein
MSGWPITLGLGQGGPGSFLWDGLVPGVLTMSLNPKRTLTPIFISGYAGRDFPSLSAGADDVFGIDLGPALDDGDALDSASLTVLFFPVDAPVTDYAAALDGAGRLIGTVAAQAIGQPPAGRYLLGFACGTAVGRRVQIHSFFNAVELPDAA